MKCGLLPTRCQRLPLPLLLMCMVILWRGMGHILAAHRSPHLAKVSLSVFVYHYSPCQPACACVPHPSFVSSWVGSERWHIKSICIWVCPREMATHSTGTNDLFPMSFSTLAHCALREGYLPPSLSRKLRSVTCSVLDHSTQLCPRGPSPHALGWLYSRNMDRVSLVKPGWPPVPSQAFWLGNLTDPGKSFCVPCLGVVSSGIQLWRLTGEVGSPCNPRWLTAVLHWKRPTNENCR